jgi:hypothetical protein
LQLENIIELSSALSENTVPLASGENSQLKRFYPKQWQHHSKDERIKDAMAL